MAMNLQRFLIDPSRTPRRATRKLALFSILAGSLVTSACGRDEPDAGKDGVLEESGITNEKSGKSKSKKTPDESKMPEDSAVIPDDSESGGDGQEPEDDPDAGAKDLPCEIDFLFVIDHSGSMESEQENLTNAVPEFIKTVKEEIDELEDYHIAVVTTGGSSPVGGHFGSPKCEKLGAMVTRTTGQNSSERTCGPYANGKKFMTKEDDLEDKFVCAAKPGTEGNGDEKPMEAMLAALSKELQTPECNAGFLRKDALLVVTIITDEEDDSLGGGVFPGDSAGSKGDPEEWYKGLIAAKGGDPKNIVVLGLVGTEKPNECEPLLQPEDNLLMEGAQISKRLMEFVNKFKKRGVIGDVCADSYGKFFRKAVGVIDLACEEKPPPV